MKFSTNFERAIEYAIMASAIQALQAVEPGSLYEEPFSEGEEPIAPWKGVENLRKFLTRLPDTHIYRLMAILDLGRDGGRASSIHRKSKLLRRHFRSPAQAISQMCKERRLVHYWGKGHQRILDAGFDFDGIWH